jgi:hypothetical protein
MFTVEIFGPTFRVVGSAIVGPGRVAAIDAALRTLAEHCDSSFVFGVRVIDENGLAVFTKYLPVEGLP